MSRDSLAQATCAVFVNGARTGTGTLVTESHVLTARHVVRKEGNVTVRFRDGMTGPPIPALLLPLPEASAALDIAVLVIDGGAARPAPAPLWPARRLPAETTCFGYPSDEGANPRGVWRESTVSGGVQGGRTQLDWKDGVGSLPGHSGGPVADKDTWLIVGVLVEGSEKAQFDRLVSLAEVRRVWDGLPRTWLFAGKSHRQHFTQRASGQQSLAQGGDLFRGRTEALRVIRERLGSPDPPGIPLVITGQPGAGKSAVLARAALTLEQDQRLDGLAFHARKAKIGDFVEAVSAACGVDTPSSWQELVETISRAGADVMVITVDALDEAASDDDLAELRRALRELARVPWLRVAVATRPLATPTDRFQPGAHLHALGVTAGAESQNLIDLDADQFFTAEHLADYAATLLTQTGYPQPSPPGGAWEQYRRDRELCSRLATFVAQRAGRNFLVAGMSAFSLAEQVHVIDPISADFDPALVPSSLDEALHKYLNQLPADTSDRFTGLLTALAYGRGAGLDEQRWLAFTKALGWDQVTANDVRSLRTSGAADFLLETGAQDGYLNRLFHQALADELTMRRKRDDERRLIGLLKEEAARSGWMESSPYVRNHAPSHAAAAGLLGELVVDAGFLVAMRPTALRPALRARGTHRGDDPGVIYDVALPFLLADDLGANAAVLELVSRVQGNGTLSEGLANLEVRRGYRVKPNIRPLDRPLARFDGHTGPVWAVVPLSWPDLDHSVVVTGSEDGTVRVWDPKRPDTELARFDGHAGHRVLAVTTLAWPDRACPVVVTGSSDGTARVFDPQAADVELARFDGHTGHRVLAVAALGWPDLDHPVVVTGSSDGTARVFDPQRPDAELARFDGHTGHRVLAVAALAWPALVHPVVVTSSEDGTARVWDPQRPHAELARFDNHTGPVQAVAALEWAGLASAVVMTGGEDRSAQVWDPQRPATALARFDGHTGTTAALAALAWPDRDGPVVVSGSTDGSARVWDPRRPEATMARFDGHTGPVVAVATLDWPGLEHHAVVTGSMDGTALVWDPALPAAELSGFVGHTGRVLTAAAVPWPGLEHPVVVTGSDDGSARVWDPERPHVELARFDEHAGRVLATAALDWRGLEHPAVVTTSDDGTARVWDPRRPDDVLARFDGHTAAVWCVTALPWAELDHPVVVTGAEDGTARVWDPLRPEVELAQFRGHNGAVWAAAALAWPGMDQPVVVTSSQDGTARVWDPRHPQAELARFDGHTGPVLTVAPLDWPGLGHPVVVSGSEDGTARVWDPRRPEVELARLAGHTGDVWAVAELAWPNLPHSAVMTSSTDGTARVWDPLRPEVELTRLPLLGLGLALAVVGTRRVVVATTRGFLVFELTPDADDANAGLAGAPATAYVDGAHDLRVSEAY